ncbi:MAG: flagellar hook-associated protein FlgL [Glaciimonas sp.]|nr:flagellar hook-associated protein FlgL [Glaciimonas sp.]
MRISTNTMYDVGSAGISQLQSDLFITNQHIGSKLRIMTPEDDPVGAARALVVTQAQSVNKQFGVNRQNAQSTLNAEDGALQGIKTSLLDAQSTVVHAGNGALTDTDRSTLATELRGRYEELLGLANTKDGTGNAVFAGYKTSSDAFVKAGSGITYQGDQGQRILQVDTSRQMALSDTGNAVFGNNGSNTFKTLDDIIQLLQTPKGTLNTTVSATSTDSAVSTAYASAVTANTLAAATPGDAALAAAAATATSAANAAAMTSASTALNKSFENVVNIHTSVGIRLSELDSLDTSGADRDLAYTTTLSQLQDLDLVKAYSDLTQQKSTLDAAQLAYVKTTSLSLFDYIK